MYLPKFIELFKVFLEREPKEIQFILHKSKKLLKFVLDIGLEERTVLSGISQYYEPETMVGKKVIYLANLAPKKMMGIESYGMILSASDWEEHLEVTNIESLPAGSIVK